MPFKEDGSRKAMMSHKPDLFKPKKHKGPYMMKPGSREVDSPGIFRANEPATLFKNNMPKSAGLRALADKNPELEYVGNKPKGYHKPKMDHK
tara:strand:+ start:36 stop:311 length:276 start_codon:yes stop_codon:yes gene_type:complete